MSSEEIEIHFEQMRMLAEGLSQLGNEIQKLADIQGMDSVCRLKAAWISENADVFVGKEIRLMKQITETAMNLLRQSEDISRKARQIYDAEMMNCLMAKARSYR